MAYRKSAYFHDVDRLHDETSVSDVLAHYGLPAPRGGNEHRLQCVFNDACHDSSYGELTINVASKEVYCHSCGVRGNLYTLLHGLETRRPPSGGKLRGEEFKSAYRALQELTGKAKESPPPQSIEQHAPVTTVQPERAEEAKPNPPLLKSEKTRSLANLYEEFVVDPGAMAPHAAAYFRERCNWLTPELCRKWGVGYLPRNGRSMFKGWVTYTHRNQRGDVITYSGRNAAYDEKLAAWVAAGRPADKKPLKHKYVKGYERGLELYGQMTARLEEPQVAESLARLGLGVVEGMNDVIRLDALGVAAVGLCSNRATDQQITKIARFATAVSNRRVWLMPDCDEEGEAGFQALLWRLHEAGLRPALAWSSKTRDGRFAHKQPEDLSPDDWRVIERDLEGE